MTMRRRRAFILGLGLADLLQSAYRLTQARGRIRLHWLSLVWALVVFALVMVFYWTFFHAGQSAPWSNLVAFIFLSIAPVILFLTSANALLDELPEDGGLDLERFYFERPRWVFRCSSRSRSSPVSSHATRFVSDEVGASRRHRCSW